MLWYLLSPVYSEEFVAPRVKGPPGSRASAEVSFWYWVSRKARRRESSTEDS